MADAIYLRDDCKNLLTVAAAVAAGEVWQLPSGKAGVYTGQNAAAINDIANFSTEGK